MCAAGAGPAGRAGPMSRAGEASVFRVVSALLQLLLHWWVLEGPGSLCPVDPSAAAAGGPKLCSKIRVVCVTTGLSVTEEMLDSNIGRENAGRCCGF